MSQNLIADYKQWNNSQRAQAFRPNDIYQGPTSPFEGATTHRMDFNEKKGNVIKATKPPTANRREPGPFDHTTTNRQDYKVFPGQRQRTSYRPVSSRYLADAPFDVCFLTTWEEKRSNFWTFRQPRSIVPTSMGKQSQYSELHAQ